jgi:hypothetical protein
VLSREHLLGASRVHDNEVFDRSIDIQIFAPVPQDRVSLSEIVARVQAKCPGGDPEEIKREIDERVSRTRYRPPKATEKTQ